MNLIPNNSTDIINTESEQKNLSSLNLNKEWVIDESKAQITDAVDKRVIEASRNRTIERIKSTLEELRLKSTQNSLIEPSKLEDLQTFIDWRNRNVDRMLGFCQILKNINNQGTNAIVQQIEILPKCMMHLTKKICKCDKKCVSDSFKDYKFDENCSLFDLQNIDTDDKYIEKCKVYDHRPENGKMIKRVVGKNINETAEQFLNKFDELCDDNNKFDEVQCDAYDLRDECLNDKQCIQESINFVKKSNCTNDEYDKQVEEITRIFDLNILPGNNMSDNILNRNVRSLDDFSTIDNPYTGSEFNVLRTNNVKTLSQSNDYAFNTAAPITVIGLVLMSFLSYLSYKNRKDYCKLGLCLSCALMIFISLIVYLTTEIL